MQQVRKCGVQIAEAVNLTVWIIFHIRLCYWVLGLDLKLLILHSLVLKINTSEALQKHEPTQNEPRKDWKNISLSLGD